MLWLRGGGQMPAFEATEERHNEFSIRERIVHKLKVLAGRAFITSPGQELRAQIPTDELVEREWAARIDLIHERAAAFIERRPHIH